MAKVDFIKALRTVQMTVPIVGAILFGITIVAVILGVLLYQVNSSNITVISNITDWLSNWTGTVVTTFTTLGTGVTIALGLLAVVIIAALFSPYLKSKGGKGETM